MQCQRPLEPIWQKGERIGARPRGRSLLFFTIRIPWRFWVLLPGYLCLRLALGSSLAADNRAWICLTNCQYVAYRDNDGDSFRVRSGTNEFMLRLYFVDAPELNLTYPERTRLQSEYYGITLDESMKAGIKAKELVRETLEDPFVVWTRWAGAGGRAKEQRFYSIILVGTNGLDEILVMKGLAQPKGIRPNLPTGEKGNQRMDRLNALEASAKRQRLGAWAGGGKSKSEAGQ